MDVTHRQTTKYKIIDHTADIGIKANGATLKELFTNTADGMFDLIVSRNKCVRPAKILHKSITISSVDKEQLLVKWLQELLYLFDSEKIIPTGYTIISLNDTNLEADIAVYKIGNNPLQLKHQIKAVTHHNVKIKNVDGLFEVRVIFDI